MHRRRNSPEEEGAGRRRDGRHEGGGGKVARSREVGWRIETTTRGHGEI